MRQFQQILLIKILLLGAFNLSEAQTLNYTTVNYPTSLCNVFNVSPARVVGGLTHYPVSGGVSYNGNALVLQTKGGTSLSTTFGTAYAIAISIKQGYSYNITVNASKQSLDPVSAPFLEIGAISSLPNPNTTNPTTCGAVDQNKWSVLQSAWVGSSYINDVNSKNYSVVQNYTPNTNLSYFTILAHSGSQSQPSTVLINSITIVETAPAPAFTLSPSSSSITCGSTTPQTFTVTNVNNTPNIANHLWNLGANNGWLLPNGNPAPASYSTGITNTLILTPDCGATQKNVSVTVTAEGNNYNTNTSIVSIVLPSLSISGNTNFCSSASYSVNNLPCNASVIWEITPFNAATLNQIGNQVNVTSNWAAGNVTLKANVSGACYSSAVQVQKQITLGVPDHLLDVLEYQGIMPVNEFYSQTSYSFGARATEPYPYYPYYIETPYQDAGTASYVWRIIKYDAYGSSTIYNLGTFGYGYNPDFYFDQAGEYDIVLDIINNNCSYHSRSFARRITVQNMWGYFSVSPNPSSGNIKIAPNSYTTSKINTKPLEVQAVEVVDKMGVVKLRQKFGKGLTTINVSVSQLPNDVYTLRIFDGQKWHSHKIVVQH